MDAPQEEEKTIGWTVTPHLEPSTVCFVSKILSVLLHLFSCSCICRFVEKTWISLVRVVETLLLHTVSS